ncbi:MAG: NAD(P)/FAD-dependent oxidoreductase [Thermoplasmata archaeon]|nr:MAG: NAD(P)/FAD-dependent oxidoreductase [Thermoplasmata archaeon]OYT59682.1 MAG: thioredoxin-disulfide reductase [Thermoplasmatales archaeon ex4484_30]
MNEDMWDVIIVGGGPAGLTTAIMCANRMLKCLVLEGGKWGGLPAIMYPSKIIPNYPGFPDGISGIELIRRWIKQAKENPYVTMKRERVIKIEKGGIVKTEENEYHGKTLVIATGTRPRELGIPGETLFNRGDKGVYYYVTHREKFIGDKVLVVGGGDTAVDAALDLVDLADEITIVHRRDRFRALDENVKKMEESKKINIMLNTEVEEIKGRDKVEEVVLVNNKTGEKTVLSVDKVVLAVGLKPNTEMFAELGIKTDDRGYIITDNMQRTNVEGIFAVGDIVKGAFRLLVVGAAHGAIASQKIYEYIRKPYWAGEDEK